MERKSNSGIRGIFQPQKRGPKPKIDRQAELIKKLNKQRKSLQERLKKLGDEIRPERCPYCGSSKVYRRGIILTGLKKAIDFVEVVKEKMIWVPRYNCYVCGKRAYPNGQIFFGRWYRNCLSISNPTFTHLFSL